MPESSFPYRPDFTPPEPVGLNPETIHFKPVPSRRNRRDGCTPERQRILIDALAKGLSATKAARAAGISRKSAYALRERPGAESFREAWDAAILMAADDAIAIVQEECVIGVLTPVFYRGRVVGWKRKFNHNLAVKAMKVMFREI